MNVVQLLVDPPAAGAWNMAVDEMLLERAANEGIATLRYYRWSPATLSLGYFQHAAQRDAHAPSRSCALVRRSSGGGAILHDREWTYSLSLPIAHPLAANAETLYRETHGLLVRVLAEFGITARMNERTLVSLGGEPFLCFQRRSVGDLLVGRHKVCGSAQRRRNGAILQHGSLLLAASAFAPELPGLAEISGPVATDDEVVSVWISQWRQALAERGVELAQPSTLSSWEIEAARRICNAQYGTTAWANRR